VQNLSVSRGGGVLTWSRSGTAPELSSVSFQSSTDGTTFTEIGIGTRVAAGWQLSGHAPPIKQNLFFRATGIYTTGLRTGSSSITQSVRNAYIGYLAFTDDDLAAGTSVIKVVHITELRTRIDALRAAHGLDPAVYTNVAIFPGKSVVQAVDILELRAALAPVYTAAGRSQPTYTTTPGLLSTILVADIAEIRAAVTSVE
jgi:hypothetical protein